MLEDPLSALRAVHAERLSIYLGQRSVVVPPWAVWMMRLGAWLRVQAKLPGKRLAVIRTPSRQLCPAFISLGAILAGAKLHDEGVVWEALRALPQGTPVHVSDESGKTTAGRIVGVTDVMPGIETLQVALDRVPGVRNGTTANTSIMLPKESALQRVRMGASSSAVDAKRADAIGVMRKLVDGDNTSWQLSPSPDCTVVAEKRALLDDIEKIEVGATRDQRISFRDLLLLSDRADARGMVALVSDRVGHIEDPADGVTVLAGSSAGALLGYCRARSVVFLLDQSEYDEDVDNRLAPFAAMQTSASVHGSADDLKGMVGGIELSVIGLPDDQAGI